MNVISRRNVAGHDHDEDMEPYKRPGAARIVMSLVLGRLKLYVDAAAGVGLPPGPDFVQVRDPRGVHDVQDQAER
jgi:hypothetical protein